jgi:bacterioferritin-associated ferredoxin
MIVCSCNVISDGDVRAVIGPRPAASSTAQVYRGLGHEPQCGRCAGSIRKIMDEGRADGPGQP